MPAVQTDLAKRLTLGAMSLGFGVVQLDVTIVNTALGSMGASLGGGIAELQWVVSAYTIAFAALILTAGGLGDLFGARKIFIWGFATFTVASLACALAPGATSLIAARAVQGVGAALLVPNSLALLNPAYPLENERGRAIGFWAAGASLALTAGPLVGGVLIALVGWRSIFLVNLPIGVAGLWLTVRIAQETARASERGLDLPGQCAAIVALGSLAGAIIEEGAHGWRDPLVLAGFAVAAISSAMFLFQENRAGHPMLPPALFANRLFSAVSIVGLLANTAFYGLIFVLSLYFQRVDGFSPLATGLAFLPMMGAVLVVNLWAPRVAERFGGLTAITAGCAIAAIGCISLAGLRPGASYAIVCAPMVAMGAGLGLLVPPLTSTLLGSVEKSRSGVAAGILNATRQTGSVLGVAVFGSLAGGAAEFTAGARQAAMIASLLLLGATGVTAFMARDRAKKTSKSRRTII